MIGIMFSIGMYCLLLLVKMVSFLFTRFYVVNSAIVGLFSFMLTYKRGWEKQTYWLLFLIVFIGSITIQYASKIARIIYGIFTCLIAAFIGYECKVDATITAQLVSVATWVLIVGFLNVLSCTGIRMNKTMLSGK